MPRGKHEKRRKRIRKFPLFLTVLIILAAALLYDSNRRLAVSEYSLAFRNLPESFDGFRIVVLSDLHAAVFGEDNKQLAEKVTEAAPDIIAITGDMIDSTGKLPLGEQFEIAESLTRKLVDVAPVYYITGNHEWDGARIYDFLDMLRGLGVNILRNETKTLEIGGDSIVLAGIDDKNGPADMIKPEELLESVYENGPDSFVVTLVHRNTGLSVYGDMGVDLVLCGHGHGGIIRIPFTDGLIGPMREWFPKYTSGLYTIEGTKIVVSRGLGNHTGMPRFLNNPHIVVAVLNSEVN